jgi:hypothetical protein
MAHAPASRETDPVRDKVQWHGDSEFRVARYRFNTKQKDQMFCPRCGASLGIDFRDANKPDFDGFGISVGFFLFFPLSFFSSRDRASRPPLRISVSPYPARFPHGLMNKSHKLPTQRQKRSRPSREARERRGRCWDLVEVGPFSDPPFLSRSALSTASISTPWSIRSSMGHRKSTRRETCPGCGTRRVQRR